MFCKSCRKPYAVHYEYWSQLLHPLPKDLKELIIGMREKHCVVGTDHYLCSDCVDGPEFFQDDTMFGYVQQPVPEDVCAWCWFSYEMCRKCMQLFPRDPGEDLFSMSSSGGECVECETIVRACCTKVLWCQSNHCICKYCVGLDTKLYVNCEICNKQYRIRDNEIVVEDGGYCPVCGGDGMATIVYEPPLNLSNARKKRFIY